MGRRGKAEKKSSTAPEGIEHYRAYRRQKASLKKGFGAWKEENHPDTFAVSGKPVSNIQKDYEVPMQSSRVKGEFELK